MSLLHSSLKVHRLVNYLRSAGFWLETDEVEQMGPQAILKDVYGQEETLTVDEQKMLKQEMLKLAEENEIREARYKMREALPHDKGDMFFKSESTYKMPFEYPVDQNLKSLSLSVLSFAERKESPSRGNLGGETEWQELEWLKNRLQSKFGMKPWKKPWGLLKR